MKILISENQLNYLINESKRTNYFKIIPIDIENENEDIDVYAASEKAHLIAKESGVNILRGKDLKSVAIDEYSNVIGGLWTEITGDEFSFDIAIDESYRGIGVGMKLIREAFSLFNLENYDGNLKYVIDVTNPLMEKILIKFGFKVKEKYMGHTIMVHPTNNPKS